jgi:CheY-like chemotaxis protein
MYRVFLPVTADAKRDDVAPKITLHRDLTGDEVVLVVEDDAAVRKTVCEALERFGYTVYEARDGGEALHITSMFNASPDLVLTDLVMPEVTGRELIDGLRNEGRLPKVLMMSGYTDDEVLRRTGPSESYPFLKKPFTVQELATKVRETLDS